MAKTKCIPSQEYLHSIFQYKEGNLYWKIRPAQRTKIGDIAGSISDGYGQVYIDNVAYKTHRIIFMMHYGYVSDQIDHIDGNGLNNKIENLRAVTNSQNQLNRKISKNSKTGYKGVCVHTQTGRYLVRVSVYGKDKYFGIYEDLELAGLVAEMAREKYHGEFARHF
jgi:hypothetical protein